MSDEGGGAGHVTDREYLNEKIDADRKLNRERFMSITAIGVIVWYFIERHLDDLNHENSRVAKVSENSVSSDTYRANEQQRKAEQDKLDERLAKYDENFTKAVTRDDLTRETKVDRRSGVDTTTKVLASVFAAVLVGFALLNYLALHDSSGASTPPTVTVTVPTP